MNRYKALAGGAFLYIVCVASFSYAEEKVGKVGFADYAPPQSEVEVHTNQSRKAEQLLIEADRVSIPPTKKMRYFPLANDPLVDPLHEGYYEWLESIRNPDMDIDDIDEDYEAFVKEISPILFSLGEKQLKPEARELLSNIPADNFDALGRSLEPKVGVAIERGSDVNDPFPPEPEEPEESYKSVGPDSGLRIAVKKPDNQVSKLIEMAYDATVSGQYEVASSLYRNALTRNPGNKQALFGLATAYHRNGQYDQARKAYIQLLEKDRNNWAAMNNFLVLAGEEAPEDALKELKELEKINPEFSPIVAQIAMIYLRLNKKDEAIKYFSRAIILSPDNLAYRYNLAVLLDHTGYRKQAAKLYSQLIKAYRKGKKLPESPQKIVDRLNFIASKQAFK